MSVYQAASPQKAFFMILNLWVLSIMTSWFWNEMTYFDIKLWGICLLAVLDFGIYSTKQSHKTDLEKFTAFSTYVRKTAVIFLPTCKHSCGAVFSSIKWLFFVTLEWWNTKWNRHKNIPDANLKLWGFFCLPCYRDYRPDPAFEITLYCWSHLRPYVCY